MSPAVFNNISGIASVLVDRISLLPAAAYHTPINKGKGSWENVHEFLNDDKTNPIIADTLRLFHVCPISDGAAALILCNAEKAKEFSDTPVLISGIGQATDTQIVRKLG